MDAPDEPEDGEADVTVPSERPLEAIALLNKRLMALAETDAGELKETATGRDVKLLRYLDAFLKSVMPKRIEARRALYRIAMGIHSKGRANPAYLAQYRVHVCIALEVLCRTGHSIGDAATYIHRHHKFVRDILIQGSKGKDQGNNPVKTITTWPSLLRRGKATALAAELYNNGLAIIKELNLPEQTPENARRWVDAYLNMIAKGLPPLT